MRPTSRQLAGRDMALATLAGALAASGATFGVEFGDDYGVEFGADPSTMTDAQKARAFDARVTAEREQILEPNKGSSAKIQRYAFGMSYIITALSTAEDISMEDKPDTVIRPQRVTCNAPLPGFAHVETIKVANVDVIVGGKLDAFEFAATGQNQSLDVPTLTPSNRVRVTGHYTGLLPSGGYVTATPYEFITSFKGPAKMVA